MFRNEPGIFLIFKIETEDLNNSLVLNRPAEPLRLNVLNGGPYVFPEDSAARMEFLFLVSTLLLDFLVFGYKECFRVSSVLLADTFRAYRGNCMKNVLPRPSPSEIAPIVPIKIKNNEKEKD